MPQASTEDGMIYSMDRTQPDVKLFTINAHDSSVSGNTNQQLSNTLCFFP